MRTGKDILIRFQKRWQLMLWLEIFLYALGAAVFVALIFQNLILSLIIFMLVGAVVMLTIRPWEIGVEYVSNYVDREVDTLEYSSGLLLVPSESLSGLARLQQQRISGQLEGEIRTLKPEHNLVRAGVITTVLVLLGFFGQRLGLAEDLVSNQPEIEEGEIIVLRPADSVAVETNAPILESQKVTISYPAYTGVSAFTTSKMDIEAVEGSRVTWEIAFDSAIDTAQMESSGNRHLMDFRNGKYSRSASLQNSGFYNFRFTDTTGASYISDLYSIKVTKDRSPEIEIEGIKQFTSFDYDEEKIVNFTAVVSDDFGIAEAFIIATVSKGTGESVKFREEQLQFDSEVRRGSKNLQLNKKIDLDRLKMEVGDELYFYVEARDLKQPSPNRSRSETFFAVIKDTVSYGPGVEGALGVDLMPDYFRSQRQLIIDTEKLIADRNKLPQKEFNSTSNDLGFDQKALRLRYGQFMGDETEGPGEMEIEEDHDHEDGEEDPLAAFTHDHDGSNEHNLVERHDHEEHDDGEEEENPIDKFFHDHGDPESATLFTDSLKSKLRQALDIMWDAELHLRMYEPEKSLPYQYKALALIQEIKNNARIYVHRIGFDPPPIKEEVRLTGKIEEVTNYQKTATPEVPEEDQFIKQAIQRLEELISNDNGISTDDKKLFEFAGNELGEKAVEEPGKHLQTLQQLKWLTEDRPVSREMLIEVQRGLLQAVSPARAIPGKGKEQTSGLNKLILKELELNDR